MKEKTVKEHIQNLVMAAMLIAVGIVLPFFTGQIPQIGSMLLPMHVPVLVCGLICGWQFFFYCTKRWITVSLSVGGKASEI